MARLMALEWAAWTLTAAFAAGGRAWRRQSGRRERPYCRIRGGGASCNR